MKSILISLLSLTAFAETIAPPVIPSELRAKYWRAQAEALAAQHQAERSKAALDQAIADLRKACGGQITAGQDGEPVCGKSGSEK